MKSVKMLVYFTKCGSKEIVVLLVAASCGMVIALIHMGNCDFSHCLPCVGRTRVLM